MISKAELLETYTLSDLIELKNCVNDIVLRTHIQGTPSMKWKEFNNFLLLLNDSIETLIYERYIK